MPNDTNNQAADDLAKQATERRVKNMLGPSPTETNTYADEPPGAPPVGSIITPDEPITNEPEITKSKEVDKPQTEKSIKPATVDPKPGNKLDRLKLFFKNWWHNPKARWATIISVVTIVLLVLLLPATRYFMLNRVGVRSNASVTVLDDSTGLPLKNVQVNLAGATSKTNDDGNVNFSHLKLGKTKLVINKKAFAPLTKSLTIGWGSNPLGNLSIKAVGSQYSFSVQDWLSGQPVEKAEADSGDANAQSDNKGKILLTVDPSQINDTQTVTIKADGYRDETFNLGTDTTTVKTIKLVPARKEVYISNRSGKYDLYAIDIDGKNEKLVLAGTGLENGNITLVPHPTDEAAALISTRVNIRNNDGYLLNTLTLVNVKDGTSFTVAQSERIQIIGWAGDRLVFIQIAAGASASSPGRFRLVSYNYKTADKKELARANSFNDAVLIGDKVYLAPSSDSTSDSGGLVRLSADGSGKQTLLNKEVWNVFRTSYDTFDLSVSQDWYQYKLGDSNATKLNQSPANPINRLYVASPDGNHNLWVDVRDGKGVLLDYPATGSKDKILQTQSGLSYPLRWLTNDTFIYRIHTDSETSDWALSLDGGTVHKIKDVYNTNGINQIYY